MKYLEGDYSNPVHEAFSFARDFHTGQVRKYTSAPYITHPVEVMRIVDLFVAWDAPGRDDMLCAALLHDVVEDTEATIGNVRNEFGDNVARMVAGLTDVSRREDGNRAKRKAIDREHLASQQGDVHTIKLADMVSNTRSIVAFDHDFAHVYLIEKFALLQVLVHGSIPLWKLADEIVLDGATKLGVEL